MTGRPQRSRPRPNAGAVAGVAIKDNDGQEGTDDSLCTCCDPRNPLVMRPDLGVLGDGSAEYALCVLNGPDPVVYRNRGDGIYVQVPDLSLSPSGEIVDQQGNTIAHVAGNGFQRLSTIDDDEPPPSDPGSGGEPAPGGSTVSRPRTIHVDLSQDDFYAAAH